MKQTSVRYSTKIAEEILDGLKLGRSLRDICKSDHLPQEASVREWYTDNKHDFTAQYARARNIGLEALEDEIQEIANNDSTDFGQMQRDRIKIDVLKWKIGQMGSKKYEVPNEIHLHEHNDTHIHEAEKVSIEESPESRAEVLGIIKGCRGLFDSTEKIPDTKIN